MKWALPILLAFAAAAVTVVRLRGHTEIAPSSTAPADVCTLTTTPLQLMIGDTELVTLCDEVYAEPGFTPEEAETLKHFVQNAHNKLLGTFDDQLHSHPFVVFCRTADCKIYFGTSPRAAAALDVGFARDMVMTKDGPLDHGVVIVSAMHEATPRILVHELVHAEMKAWVPYRAMPTWFNEGTATFVADEPRCSARQAGLDAGVVQLDTQRKWEERVGSSDPLTTYCQARAEVAAWASRFETPTARAAALRQIMGRVATGGPFELTR